MTNVITVNGPETLWLMADRRLTAGNAVVSDRARKVMVLETTDGVALLSYCGLGRTLSGTEPADWMSRVLRGVNAPLEQSLAILANAAKREIPLHLSGIRTHSIIATAFIGQETRIYTIDLMLPPHGEMAFRYTRHLHYPELNPSFRFTPSIAFGGSGGLWLMQDKRWPRRLRDLLRVARACDRGKVSPRAVADSLAAINHWVYEETTVAGGRPSTIGPDCIVVWRHRRQGLRGIWGAHEFYNGVTREPGGRDGNFLPIIGNGQDITSLVKAMLPQLMAQMDSALAGKALEIDQDKLNAALAKISDKPDERLR